MTCCMFKHALQAYREQKAVSNLQGRGARRQETAQRGASLSHRLPASHYISHEKALHRGCFAPSFPSPPPPVLLFCLCPDASLGHRTCTACCQDLQQRPLMGKHQWGTCHGKYPDKLKTPCKKPGSMGPSLLMHCNGCMML